MRNVNRPIPEIFIPKPRPKRRRAEPRAQLSLAASVAAEEQRDRELAQLDQLMRSNTCHWL